MSARPPAPLVGVRPDRELPEEIGEIIQGAIEQGYREFLQRVADSRDMSVEEVDKVAQGRVWSGTDAYDLGLVDHLGGLSEAVAAAASLAELGDDYQVTYVEKELEWQDRLLGQMLARAADTWGHDISGDSPLDQELQDIRQAAADFAALNDPSHVYAISSLETD